MKIRFNNIEQYDGILMTNKLLEDCVSRDSDSYYIHVDNITEYHIKIHDDNFNKYKSTFDVLKTILTDVVINLYCYNLKYEEFIREKFKEYCEN